LRAGGTVSEKSAASVKPFPIGSGVRRVNQCGYVATTHPIILAVPIVYSANLSTAFDANRGAVSRMPTLDHNLTGRWRDSRAKKTTETDRQEASSLAREPELLSDPTTEPHSRNRIDMIPATFPRIRRPYVLSLDRTLPDPTRRHTESERSTQNILDWREDFRDQIRLKTRQLFFLGAYRNGTTLSRLAIFTVIM
jgi:hypothetical protein